MPRWNWENHSDCEGQEVGLTRPTPFANDAPSSTPEGDDSQFFVYVARNFRIVENWT